MLKTDRGRIDETLNYIRTAQLGGDMTSAGCKEAHAFAEAFVNRRYARLGLFAKNAPMHAFSQKMALGLTYVGTENSVERKQRRAVTLLDAAIKDAFNLVTAPIAPRFVGNVQDQLVTTMWKARLVQGQINNSDEPHRRWLAQFRLNPTLFLNRFPIHIAGSTAQATGLNGLPTDQNVQTYFFAFDHHKDLLAFYPNNPYNGVGIQAVSVVAEAWTSVPGRGNNPNSGSFAQIHGTVLEGADIMLTTQFTGCALCFKKHLGKVWTAHISPGGRGGGLTGQALAAQLAGLVTGVTGGDFANASGGTGTFHVHGRMYSDAPGVAGGYSMNDRMYVIGFPAQGGWSIYAQTQDTQRAVTSVTKVL